jgi:hypothetical protein
LSPGQRRVRLYTLEKIMRLAETNRVSPRLQHVSAMTLLSTLCALGLHTVLSKMGLAVPPYFVPSVIALSAGMSAWRWTGARSWAELLGHELARYEPLDAPAFQAFQQHCREQSSIPLDAARSWLAGELQALDRQAAQEAQRQRPNPFLK